MRVDLELRGDIFFIYPLHRMTHDFGSGFRFLFGSGVVVTSIFLFVLYLYCMYKYIILLLREGMYCMYNTSPVRHLKRPKKKGRWMPMQGVAAAVLLEIRYCA